MTATLTKNDDHRLAPPHRQRPRRQGILLSVGALAVAGVLLVLGAVMAGNANFSRTYTSDQLAQQKITFKPVDALTAEERKSACVVENAGKLLTTGKQAECFANEFIGLHIKSIGQGRTYAELGDAETALRTRATEAQTKGDPAAAGLQKELTDLSRQRDLVFKAESLRGMLLTSYGFSVLGEKGAQAANAAYGGAAAMALLSAAGMVWAVTTKTAKRETTE